MNPRIETSYRWRLSSAVCTAFLAVLGGCSNDALDTSTPTKALDAIAEMVTSGHPEGLPQMIEKKKP